MEVTKTQDVAEFVAPIKQGVNRAKTQLLATFAAVPDDKLNWSPSASARSALRIVAHCVAVNNAFAAMTRGEGWGLSMNPEEAIVQIRTGEPVFTTRAAAIASLETSFANFMASLDDLSPELLDTHVKTAFGMLPMTVLVTVPRDQMLGHACQIDYLETIWGDLDFH